MGFQLLLQLAIVLDLKGINSIFLDQVLQRYFLKRVVVSNDFNVSSIIIWIPHVHRNAKLIVATAVDSVAVSAVGHDGIGDNHK